MNGRCILLILIALMLIAVSPLAAQVKITQLADRITVDIDGKPYTAFYLAPNGGKPYVWPLSTASGIVVTRRFPLEKVEGEQTDHPHHRGLFFAHGSVNGIDFWAPENNPGQPKEGRMVLKKVLQAKGGAKSGTIKAVFDALEPGGTPLMTETRTITFHTDPELRIIDYEIEMLALVPLTFGETKEGTFGIRLATPLSGDRTGKMVNAEGQETEKNVWGKRSPWVDYFGQLDGKTVGVAIMDNPSTPRIRLTGTPATTVCSPPTRSACETLRVTRPKTAA
jgi:hypothetical protein